jgi:aldose 1-epimerase
MNLLHTISVIPLLCTVLQAETTITQRCWGTTQGGEAVDIFTLSNHSKISAQVATYGAMLVRLDAPDRNGKLGSIVAMDKYELGSAERGLWGQVIGRYANRIDNAGFTIDDNRYNLHTYDQTTKVHIHGGKTGFHRQVFDSKIIPHGVEFTHSSPDGHEGFPGQVEVSVKYELIELDLRITYTAKSTQPTHINLTNHAYFNLTALNNTNVLDHQLKLFSDKYLDIDSRKIPTGKYIQVCKTPFDFQQTKRIGEQIEAAGGYDHCFVVNGKPGTLRPAAIITDPQSGRKMEVLTTTPGLQIYTASKPNFPKWSQICFETQHFPDSPNRPEFPSTLLRPQETYREVTVFRCSTIK